MATSKSTVRGEKRPNAKLPEGMAQPQLKDLVGEPDEVVSIPYLMSPKPAKAPAIDPHIRPETLRTRTVDFPGAGLPVIFSGKESGKDLSGNPKDYAVEVMWVSREQINQALDAIATAYPDTREVLKIARKYMSTLDTMRDETKFAMSLAAGQIKSGSECASHNLAAAAGMLGHWGQEHRLYL